MNCKICGKEHNAHVWISGEPSLYCSECNKLIDHIEYQPKPIKSAQWWSTIPSEFNWYAIDMNGYGVIFMEEPHPSAPYWICGSEEIEVDHYFDMTDIDWTKTLQFRGDAK